MFSGPAVFDFQKITEADMVFCSLRRIPGNVLHLCAPFSFYLKEEIAKYNFVCFNCLPNMKAICDGMVKVHVSVRLGRCFCCGKQD